MSTADDTNAAPGAADAVRALPVIVLVGRPNAGKSTLFNRLIRQQRAIVNAEPGVTRDRNIARASWEGRPYLLVDTGGFEDSDVSDLAHSIRAQSALAAAEADVVVALLDGREGVNPADREFVQRLRRLRKPVVFAVNKLDTVKLEDDSADFFRLGLEAVIPLSAAHGHGVSELMERVFAHLPVLESTQPAGGEGPVRLAIVGRPNVGKSSLLNRIVGFERSIVSAIPGTTRDPVDSTFAYGAHEYLLVDTAGIRRRPRVTEQLERSSVVRALRGLEEAEVALLVLDAIQGMTDQDARIAGYGWERGRALLLVFNKWDAVDRSVRDRRGFLSRLQSTYPTLGDIPVAFLSARTGSGMSDLFPSIAALVTAHRRRVRTTDLNRVLQIATEAQAAPAVRGKAVRFYYATQTGSSPPLVTIFSNHPEAVPASYVRYLTNELRRAFGWNGTPLQIRFRPRREKDTSRRRPTRHNPSKRGRNKRRR